MSDLAVTQKLEVVGTIKDGLAIGTKNLVPILVNVILWTLTFWIPYLNVGTTIGLMVGIVSKAARGETIEMTEIFDSKYRKYMGEFFLAFGLVGVGVGVGYVFAIIPGIIISLAWSLTFLLVIDKGKNPMEAIALSNQCTYGYKGKIFLIYFLPMIAFYILLFIFTLIPVLGILLNIALVFLLGFFIVGLNASIYKQLTEGVA